MNGSPSWRSRCVPQYESDVAAWVLIVLALVKVMATLLVHRKGMDPLFEVDSRYLAGASAGFELGIGYLVLRLTSVDWKDTVVTLCAVFFFIMRGLYNNAGVGVANCPCLGNIEGIVPFVRAYKENILWAISLFLLFCPAVSVLTRRFYLR